MAKNLRSATLSVNLPMELAQAVYQQVRDGKFDSDDEVVRAALRHFLQTDEGDAAPEVEPTRRERRRAARDERAGG
jgi:Arc/MetJ-type ribon-helix-helix transcriptional regulator